MSQTEKGLRRWAVTPLFDMAAGPGIEPGAFGLLFRTKYLILFFYWLISFSFTRPFQFASGWS